MMSSKIWVQLPPESDQRCNHQPESSQVHLWPSFLREETSGKSPSFLVASHQNSKASGLNIREKKQLFQLKSKASYLKQGKDYADQMGAPRPFYQDCRFDNQPLFQEKVHSKSLYDSIGPLWNSVTRKKEHFRTKSDGSLHSSLPVQISEDYFNQKDRKFTDSNLTVGKLSFEITREPDGENLIYEPIDHTSSPAAGGKVSVSNRLKKSILTNSVNSMPRHELNGASFKHTSQDLMCYTRDMDYTLCNLDMMKYIDESQDNSPSSSSIPLGPPIQNRNQISEWRYQKQNKTSEVWSLDYFSRNGSSSMERSTLGVCGSALDSPSDYDQKLINMRKSDTGLKRSLSFSFSNQIRKRRGSVSQIQTPDDFLENAAYYGERSISSLMGSSPHSPFLYHYLSPVNIAGGVLSPSSTKSDPLVDFKVLNQSLITGINSPDTQVLKKRTRMMNYCLKLDRGNILRMKLEQGRREKTLL